MSVCVAMLYVAAPECSRKRPQSLPLVGQAVLEQMKLTAA
jgi:hypothetical protein